MSVSVVEGILSSFSVLNDERDSAVWVKGRQRRRRGKEGKQYGHLSLVRPLDLGRCQAVANHRSLDDELGVGAGSIDGVRHVGEALKKGGELRRKRLE